MANKKISYYDFDNPEELKLDLSPEGIDRLYDETFNEYICDDRNTLENVRSIKNMSDEEFEKYIEELREKQNND